MIAFGFLYPYVGIEWRFSMARRPPITNH